MKNNWKAVFFDFDGVILDSVDVKTKAFAAMFRDYGPEIEKAVVDYHLAHGGVSRFEKFKYYYNKLLSKPIDEMELQRLGKRFNGLVLEKVLAAPFIPGALETLKELKEKSIPAFVVSGTPDDELKVIVEKRTLTDYFVEVHGSPRTKSEVVKDLLGRYHYNPSECLFVGDAMTDYAVAKEQNMIFLGILRHGKCSEFPNKTSTSTYVHVCL